MIIHVASLSDPRLDDYRNVPDPELLRDRGIFVAEGRQVVRRLLTESRFTTRSLLLTEAAHGSLADVLPHLGHLPVFVVSQEALHAITGFNIHRGCLAIGERSPAPPWQAITRDARRLVVLERVSNADNVGSVFRNAAAFAVDGVLLGPSCADPLYRKAIRTSMGAALRVPFAMLGDWPSDLVTLKALGIGVVALTPSPGAPTLGEVKPPARWALLLGHEGEGLSDDAQVHADLRVRIPMVEGFDSVNVATAAAIALYAFFNSTNPKGGTVRDSE